MPTPPPSFRLDRLELGFVCLFVWAASLSWVGSLLAEFRSFRLNILVPCVLVLGVAGTVWAVRSLRAAVTDQTTAHGTWLFVAALLVGSAFTLGRPMEAIISAADASVYLNVGRIIERTGGSAFDDPLLELIPEDDRPHLFLRDGLPPRLLNRFPGGLQIEDGRTISSFLHLFPVWIATFVAAFGPRAGPFVNPAFGMMSLVALFLLGRRLSSPLAGALAATLLALNFGQIWFARMPLAEMTTQYLVLSGTFFTILLLEGGPPVVGLCAAAAFGLSAFGRLDSLLFISPLVAAFLLIAPRWQVDRSAWRWFVGGFAFLTLHALGHLMFVAHAYTFRTFDRMWLPVRRGNFRMLIAVVGVLVPLFFWALLQSNRLGQRGRRIAKVIGLAVLAAVLVRVSPLLLAGAFAHLITPLGSVMALSGVALLLLRPKDRRGTVVVLLFATTTLLFIQARRDNFTIPFGLRRYVPVALPVALLLGAHFIARLDPRIRNWN